MQKFIATWNSHERESVLSAFTAGRIPVLVATDILSRGIDIDTIDVVINYDVPGDGEDYVHRIGRTARAEADGAAFTLIGEKEQNKFAVIEQLLEKEVEKAEVPKEFGAAPMPIIHRTRSARSGNRRTTKKISSVIAGQEKKIKFHKL